MKCKRCCEIDTWRQCGEREALKLRVQASTHIKEMQMEKNGGIKVVE